MRLHLLMMALLTPATWAQLSVQVSPSGAIERIRAADATVAQSVHLRIVKPGWEGTWADQLSGGDLTILEPIEGAEGTFSGRFECEGKPCHLSQRVKRLEDGWKVSYELTPSADMEAEGVFIMVDLPTAGNAGAGRFLVAEQDVVISAGLPAEKADPYHITSSAELRWCGWLLPGDVGLMIRPDGDKTARMSFQDNREFNFEAFQAQFSVPDTRNLKANRTYTFGLTFSRLDLASLEAQGEQVLDTSEDLTVALTSGEPLALGGITLDRETVGRYDKLEIDLDLDATFDNPFDPDDIDVTALFTAPDDRQISVPGFYYQQYDPVRYGDRFALHKVGEPGWKVRFCPMQEGRWQVVVRARDRSGQVTSSPAWFECASGTSPGFIRRCPDNPYYLQFDNGAPYFAVGENVCWAPPGQTHRYDEWLSALGAAGGNYCRIWLVRWNMGLEWTNQGPREGVYYGLGRYSLDNAARLDWVLAQARDNGIYCMLALGYHGELADKPDYFKSNCWEFSPYNAANGGPCAEPADFWTDGSARKLYKQRLRYYIARWGWDAHILSWEFWNEVRAPEPWVREMARCLEQSDPYAHLVTTTYGYDRVWQIPQLDYTQAHTYGVDESRRSTAPVITHLCRTHTRSWPKPFMVGEFGIDWKRSDGGHDPNATGISLHNGLWASVVSRSFGTAATWWWDAYIHPNNLYGEFTSIRKFVDRVPWPQMQLEFAAFDPARIDLPDDTPWVDCVVRPTLGWHKSAVSDITVGSDGKASGDARFSSFLFAESKSDMRTPLRFHVTYPRDGRFALHIAKVSQGATVVVLLDGVELQREELLAGEGDGPWKSTEYVEEHDIWQSVYDKQISVPVPAGKHVIEVQNTGKDWVQVPRYTFAGCRDPGYVDINFQGLRTDQFAVLWAHDTASTWYNDKHGKAPAHWEGVSSALHGLREGRYRVDWWHTRTGEIVSTEQATCMEGRLPLSPPAFQRDIAAQVWLASP